MSTWLRSALLQIFPDPASGSLRKLLPGGFGGPPGTTVRLGSLTDKMSNPVTDWSRSPCERTSTDDWARLCEGITTDGTDWFITSNYHGPFTSATKDHSTQGVYRVDIHYNQMDFGSLSAIYDYDDGLHVGDLDYHDGKLYIAMQNPHGIAIVNSANLQLETFLRSPQDLTGDTFAWCAINPFNGLAYTSLYGADGDPPATTLFALSLQDPLVRVRSADIPMRTPPTPLNGNPWAFRSMQGGAFTPNGHLVMSTDEAPAVYCFSSLNGHLFSWALINRDSNFFDRQEVEGVCFRPLNVSCDDNANTPTLAQVHVLLLGNAATHDIVWLKHYTSPHTPPM